MVKVKKINKEIVKNRILILIVFAFVTLSSLMVLAIYFDIAPQDVIPETFTTRIDYVNTSTVYVPNEIISVLNTRYNADNKEFVYCLYGDIYYDEKDNTEVLGYIVNEMKETDVIEAQNDYITYKRCKKTDKYLGTIHSHPQPEKRGFIAICELSKQDIFTFGAEQMPLTGVICGENKIAIYGTEDFDKSYEIKIIKSKN